MRLEPLYRICFTYPESWAVGLDGGWQQLFFIAEGRLLRVTQDERGGVTHDEHAEPDIPGSRVAGGAHGGGGTLMVTAVRGVDAAGCSW
jgi:hypothetical protein